MTGQKKADGGAVPYTEAHAVAHAVLALQERPATGECVAPDTIVAWVEGRIDNVEATQIKSHVAACDTCYQQWVGLLEAIEVENPAASSQDSTSGLSQWLASFLPHGGRVGAIGSVMAAAAVGFIWLGVSIMTSSPGALPRYAMSLPGSAEVRGVPADSPTAQHTRLKVGDKFDLAIIPESPVDGRVDVRAFIATDAFPPLPLDAPPPQVNAEGVIRIRGIVGDTVRLPVGSSILTVVVGRPDALSDAAALAQTLVSDSTAGDAHWRAWRWRLDVEMD